MGCTGGGLRRGRPGCQGMGKEQKQVFEKHGRTGLRPIASGKNQLVYNGSGRIEIVPRVLWNSMVPAVKPWVILISLVGPALQVKNVKLPRSK